MRETERSIPLSRECSPKDDGTTGENDRCGTFGERGGAKEKSKTDTTPGTWSFFKNERGAAGHRSGKSAGEEHVRSCSTREYESGDAGGEHNQGEQAGGAAVEAPSQPGNCGGGKYCCNGGRQAGGELTLAENLEGCGGGPVIKHGLFKPRRAVQSRSDPIAGALHGTRDGNVARFVGADQTESALSAEVSGITDEEEDREKPERNARTAAWLLVKLRGETDFVTNLRGWVQTLESNIDGERSQLCARKSETERARRNEIRRCARD